MHRSSQPDAAIRSRIARCRFPGDRIVSQRKSSRSPRSSRAGVQDEKQVTQSTISSVEVISTLL